jgi:chromosome segregation ATPase
MTGQLKLTRVMLKNCQQECAQLQREMDTWRLRVDEAGERIEQLQRERDEAQEELAIWKSEALKDE